MSKRTKLFVAGAVTLLAASVGGSAPAVASASGQNSLTSMLMDHSWCC